VRNARTGHTVPRQDSFRTKNVVPTNFSRIRNSDFFEEGRNGPCSHSANEGFDNGVEEFDWKTVHTTFFLLARGGEVNSGPASLLLFLHDPNV
jgi:hypothetical protein